MYIPLLELLSTKRWTLSHNFKANFSIIIIIFFYCKCFKVELLCSVRIMIIYICMITCKSRVQWEIKLRSRPHGHHRRWDTFLWCLHEAFVHIMVNVWPDGCKDIWDGIAYNCNHIKIFEHWNQTLLITNVHCVKQSRLNIVLWQW